MKISWMGSFGRGKYYIYDPIYKINWIICINMSYDVFKNGIFKAYGIKLTSPEGEFAGRTHWCINKIGSPFVIIWIKNFKYSFLSHEAIHGVNMVFNDIKLEITRENDEAQTYYVEFIVKSIEDMRGKKCYK